MVVDIRKKILIYTSEKNLRLEYSDQCSNEKYRRINCNKDKVHSELTDLIGIHQVLESLEWVYDQENNWFDYDHKKDTGDLKKMSEYLEDKVKELEAEKHAYEEEREKEIEKNVEEAEKRRKSLIKEKEADEDAKEVA